MVCCISLAMAAKNRHGGSQPRIKEGASHHVRSCKNTKAFLSLTILRQGTPAESRGIFVFPPHKTIRNPLYTLKKA